MTLERKNEYDKAYMNCALSIAQLSYARRSKVGCIIVSDKGQIISQGFNGTPIGTDNCCEDIVIINNHICSNCEKEHCEGCDNIKLVTKPEVLHAESNAISKCAKWISSTENGVLYVTLSPCLDCAKLIIQAGIKKVFYHEPYRDLTGVEFLKKNGIEVQII